MTTNFSDKGHLASCNGPDTFWKHARAMDPCESYATGVYLTRTRWSNPGSDEGRGTKITVDGRLNNK